MKTIRLRKPATDAEKFVTPDRLNPGDVIIDPSSGVHARVKKLETKGEQILITYDERDRPPGRLGIRVGADWEITRVAIDERDRRA